MATGLHFGKRTPFQYRESILVHSTRPRNILSEIPFTSPQISWGNASQWWQMELSWEIDQLIISFYNIHLILARHTILTVRITKDFKRDR